MSSSLAIGTPSEIITQIRSVLPNPLYADPNFIEPVIPEPDDAQYDLWRLIVQLYPNL